MTADTLAGRDFYISYTKVDQAWAEWIAVQLERAGYTTVIHSFDSAPGSDFVYEMQIGLQKAARVIAVLSPVYFQSKVAEAEWRSVLASDPPGELGRLVPVRVQPLTVPGLLQTRMYIDLVDVDEATARSAC